VNAAADDLRINAIRFLAVDAVQQANSGHPGLPLGAAATAYTLWTRHLRFNPADPKWFDRDRFVLSAGHGSALLYALLYLTGYDLPLDELKRFRQLGSRTPGHPEYRHTPGVEVTTGPLGQGFANGVGMAIQAGHHLGQPVRLEFQIVVQQRDKLRFRCRETLIICSAKTPIVRVYDEAQRNRIGPRHLLD